MLVILMGHKVLGKGNPFRLPGRHSQVRVPPSPRACDPDGGEFSECCSCLQPSGYQLRDVTARLQWMGQMRWEQAGATPVDSSGTGARDQGPGTAMTTIRDHGPWQSQQVGMPMEPGFHDGPFQATQRLSVAEGVDRWAEELSLALTKIHRGPNSPLPTPR